MYQINKNFFIGVAIVEVLSIVGWVMCAFGFPIWAAAIIMLVFNSIYFTLFFITFKAINEDEKETKKKEAEIGEENIIHITKAQAKQFRKEGALMINGKEYINEEHPLWKLNNQKSQLEL